MSSRSTPASESASAVRVTVWASSHSYLSEADASPSLVNVIELGETVRAPVSVLPRLMVVSPSGYSVKATV